MKKYFLIFIFSLGFVRVVNAQLIFSDNPLAHTYSIVARDAQTGEMGVAVQSHWYSVGTIVTWGEPGVGVIATQSFVNASFGPNGLDMLKKGMTASKVVDDLITSDEGKEFRQLAVLDVNGNVSAFTGKSCIKDAGHIVGKDFSVQANLMLNDKVWPAMADAFKNSKGQLAERMLAALEAAQSVGGDIRGKQSAAILVVSGKSSGKIWEDRLVDIRVDDNDQPLKELARILKVHRAYEHMNKGDLAMEKNDMETALLEYSTAESMFPENAEMKFWHAVTLANNGLIEKSLPLFEEIFKKDENWRILLPRLPQSGLLNVSEDQLRQILHIGEK